MTNRAYQRSATQKQKLALYARDKHCVNCGLRATACDVHHIKPWEHGGKTNINNLVLLCPTCHTQTHKHQPQPPPTRRFKQPIYSNVLLST
ncbi:HNH endonuclease signature motif containing protein [Candidatus Poriferisocius sp.]|uniref:HNH endonuclease signature motif containing protein n=1 Tax=Candidatus Poriferisocius sp. TaxID=3101276 RepID=UPI003B021F78